MSVNKVILVGNLGKDPELRYTPSGAAVANFSLATSERYKDKSGEWVDKTEWHNIVAWRNLAEICGKYLHKGKQVYIEGKIQTRSYEANDGSGKRYMTEIVADQMQMLGRAGDEGGGSGQRAPQQRPQNQGYGQGNQGNQGGGKPAPENFPDPPFNPEDDIPF